MIENLDALWNLVCGQFHAPHGWSVHGPDHWRRVERNALVLATRTGADVAVVRLFALFHDCCRLNDGHDPGHGARGADYAAQLRGKEFALSDERFEVLHYACNWHTDGKSHPDPTIATCWDADRLDLGRVGVIPNPNKMCTKFGQEIAAFGSIYPWVKETGVSVP